MSDLKSSISALIYTAAPSHVWVPADFAQLGNRDAIDKTLQRMVQAGEQRWPQSTQVKSCPTEFETYSK